ncbi:MAG: DUF3450 family protein [Phycisphaerae bacterium]|nr:DUF3450 family protein [Phycisphaerae bacterium]
MRSSSVRLFVVCVGLVVLFAAGRPAAMTAEPIDPNNAGLESPQSQKLSEKLEALIRQLRELRSNYYLQKAKDDAEIEKTRRNREILESDLEDVRRQEADLDQQNQKYDSEAEALRNELVERSGLQKVVRRQLEPFVSSQRAAIADGIPYKQQDRIARLQAACEDCNDVNGVSAADQLGRFWSYVQEELRLGRSSETYTARSPGVAGASPHARYFRVGQLVLGYVTEDGGRTGIWSALPKKKGWLLISDPKQSEQVRSAVAILDRRQGPKLLMLPVIMQSKSSTEGDR